MILEIFMNSYFSSLIFNELDSAIKLVEKIFKKSCLSLLYNLYITEFIEKELEN